MGIGGGVWGGGVNLFVTSNLCLYSRYIEHAEHIRATAKDVKRYSNDLEFLEAPGLQISFAVIFT